MGKKKRLSDPHHANSDQSSTTDSDDDIIDKQKDCPHISRSIDNVKLRKTIKSVGLQIQIAKCSECKKMPDEDNTVAAASSSLSIYDEEFDRSLWLCLRCGTQLCGRFCNQHASKHWTTSHSDPHSIVLNTSTFQLWCYDCDTEISVPRRKKQFSELIDFIKDERNKLERKENIDCISSVLSIAQTLRGVVNIDATTSLSLQQTSIALPKPQEMHRVRGLTNLGNTCFFNAVLQCLAQTPFLTSVLETASKPGENFELSGGTLALDNGDEINLPPIKSKLCAWYPLTEALHETLKELQKSGGTHNPIKLFNLLIKSRPQFSGGDQHDSHELLRHLLESVRTEDLKRYQKEILTSLEFKDKNIKGIGKSDDMRKKCKMYGGQAEKRILIPEQVFRGYLVSTLQCQDCSHVSPRFESFLDISLPVNVEKSTPPFVRRKTSPEPLNSSPTRKNLISKDDATNESTTEKHLSKKEQRNLKKKMRTTKCTKQSDSNVDSTLTLKSTTENASTSSSSTEQLDADIEDNLTDEKFNDNCHKDRNRYNNGSSTMEKCDDCPEKENKDITGGDNVNDGGEGYAKKIQTEMLELEISDKGRATLIRQATNNDDVDDDQQKNRRTRIRTNSYTDWSTTLSSRYKCDENECSIQSCLNSFTAVELMCGNNKVGCDQCTELFHGKSGKTMNTNATKQFLISSPPAVMILHLKRFQVGPRYMFRKLSKHVSFPFILDVANVCATNVKNLPNVKRHQKKIVYSLYGIVEHSGSMHGGHYTAYVKVRLPINADDPRWAFIPKGNKTELDQSDEQEKRLEIDLEKARERERRAMANHDDNINGDKNDSDDSLFSSSSEQAKNNSDNNHEPDIKQLPGKWYYVSDSQVREANEDDVQKAQAYLLFYERIY